MRIFPILHWRLPPSTVPWRNRAGLVLGAVAIFWICTFKIMDRDFWWHITSGKVMLQTHQIIETDPFAFTREGLPYLATHEWLAQIFLWLIFHFFGSPGIILLRGVIASLCAGLLLLLCRRKSMGGMLLAVWAVVITKGSFLERPQLFTFLLFSLFLLLAFWFLDAESFRTRLRICLGFAALELLWVNLHGGAALLGLAIVTFVMLQEIVRWWRERNAESQKAVSLLGGTLGIMAAVIILPPNGFGTLTYLWNLLNDQTVLYIAEWRPRDWSLYIADLWPFWLMAIAALWNGRRHAVFNLFLLAITAYLSRQAFRHEVLFVLAALATCFYQWGRSERADRMREWFAAHSRTVALMSVLTVVLLGRAAYARSWNFEQQDNLYGFGQFDLARGAYDFIERERITGNMFNTYGIGGYLIYRGYPDRKVFIDGRNVDYGMDFMTRTYAAGVNSAVWKELAERYGITYALIDYDAIREKDRLPYSVILDQDPQWPLVYLDDWVAVYVKDIPANRGIIERFRYRHLTATAIQFHDGFPAAMSEALAELEQELRRMQQDNPEGVKATLALGNLALRQGRTDDARAYAENALRVRPNSPEPYAILGAAYVSTQQWNEAADAYDMLLHNAGDSYPDINVVFIAEVFEKAGRTRIARSLRRTAGMPAAQPATGMVQERAASGSLLADPARDAADFNEQGIIAVEMGSKAEAEQAFRTAVMLNPSFAEAWNNLCALLLSLERTEEAIAACVRAVEAYPDYADAHFNLALAYFRSGSLLESEREALKAKELGREKESDDLLLLVGRKKL